MSAEDEKIARFLSVTDSDDDDLAKSMLAAHGWDVDAALNAFFAGDIHGTGQSVNDSFLAQQEQFQDTAFSDAFGRTGHDDFAVHGNFADEDVDNLEAIRNLGLRDHYPTSPAITHTQAGNFTPLQDFSLVDDSELSRALALSAANFRAEERQQEFIRGTAIPEQQRTFDSRAMAAFTSVGIADADDEAFMEAAIMASLEQAQPAENDEDDPLFAQALKASLEPSVPAQAQMFPNLRAQQAAEDRAAAQAMAASFGGLLPEQGLYDLEDDGSGYDVPAYVPRLPSENTLKDRQLRRDQDSEYEQSLAADRAKEEQRLAAERQKEAEAARAAEQERAQEAARQGAAAAARTELERKRQAVPAEPPAGPGVAHVAVRLPDGSRLGPRRFLTRDPVAAVRAYVDVARADRALGEGAAAESLIGLWSGYELAMTMPTRTLTEQDESLEAAGISGQVLLTLSLSG